MDSLNSSKASMNLAKHVFYDVHYGRCYLTFYMTSLQNCTNVAQQFLGFVTRPPTSLKSGKTTMFANYLTLSRNRCNMFIQIDMFSSQTWHDISHIPGVVTPLSSHSQSSEYGDRHTLLERRRAKNEGWRKLLVRKFYRKTYVLSLGGFIHQATFCISFVLNTPK